MTKHLGGGLMELDIELELSWKSVDACPVCGNTRKHFYAQETWGTLKINFWICRCGLVYADRVPENDEEIRKYYEEYYTPLTKGYWGEDRLLENETYRAERIAQGNLARGEVHRHLDIGCGYGMMMQTMQAQHGCISEGCDVRDMASKRGFKVYPNLAEVEGKYDLVTVIHTLEHSPDPLGYLKAIRSVCSKYLFMEVPSFAPLTGVLSSHHLFGFTTHTLYDIVELAGFKVIEVGQAMHVPPDVPEGHNKVELQIFAEVIDE